MSDFTTEQLKNWALVSDHIVAPIWGPGSYDKETPWSLAHRPRVKGDPYPWLSDNGSRYRRSEVTVIQSNVDIAAGAMLGMTGRQYKETRLRPMDPRPPVEGTLVDPFTWIRR